MGVRLFKHIAIAATLLLGAPGAASADDAPETRDWAVMVFAGQFVDNDFDELINPAAIEGEDAGLAGVALSRKIAEPFEGLDIELEGQIVRHFGDQDHWEVNAPVVARWTAFPWDDAVDTSAADRKSVV